MRGNDGKQNELFSYISLEAQVPKNHPLRKMREMVDEALEGMSGDFDEMYSRMGRPSIPPEHLLRALLIQMLYSIRSERMLMGPQMHKPLVINAVLDIQFTRAVI